MKAKKIYNSDVRDILISSLPSRPTAPPAFGGKGYGASEMKEAFDKLPLYIIERYNELLSDVTDLGENSLAGAIPTGIKDGQKLNNLFEDLASGELATYFGFLGKSLLSHVIGIYAALDALDSRISDIENVKEGVKE